MYNIHFFIKETAINIGYSCQLITDEMEEIFIVDGETYDSVEKQLQDALEEIKTILSENKKEKEEVSFVNGGVAFYNGQTANVSSSPDLQHSNEFALVINGHSLVRYCGTRFIPLILLKQGFRLLLVWVH